MLLLVRLTRGSARRAPVRNGVRFFGGHTVGTRYTTEHVKPVEFEVTANDICLTVDEEVIEPPARCLAQIQGTRPNFNPS